MFKRKALKPFPMATADVDALGTYNAERHRGIAHTPEHVERMAALQAEFDARLATWDPGGRYPAAPDVPSPADPKP